MAPADVITNRLARSSWKSWLQAVALVLVLFAFLPLTRVMTESQERPIEVSQVLYSQPTVSHLNASQDSTAVSTEPAPMLPVPEAPPLATPSDSLAQLPMTPFRPSSDLPVPRDHFDFPLEEAFPDPAPSVLVIDHAPELVYQPSVIYPHSLQRRRIPGSVTVRFSVGTDGKVQDIQIEKAPPQEAFQKAVIRAIRRGKWKPGNRNGRPIAAWVRRTIDFQP